MYFFGWYFFLRKGILGDIVDTTETHKKQKSFSLVLREGLPLLLAIAGAITLETLFTRLLPGTPFEWGVIIALIIAVICIMLQNRLGLSFIKQVFGKKNLWSMLLVIVSIFIFKDIMHAAGIVDEMAKGAGGNIALFAAAVFLPFLVGMVAGINVAFVGATFPLLLGMLHSLSMESQIIPFLVLGSFAGFTGVMISPIHICFVLTCKYFEADIAKAWRRLVAPSLLFGLFGGGLFVLLKAF
jgi:uncharacterized protein